MSQGALGAVKMAVSWSFRAGLRERERERERESRRRRKGRTN
jgi:hypothetical protein